MSSIEDLNRPTEAGAELAELHSAYDQALAELPAWKREESAVALAALRKALPPLAGHVGASHIRNMIGVFVPSDVIGIEEAARIALRTPERVRQWCRSGKLGRLVGGKWMIGRAELETFLADRRTRAGRPRKYY